jgi:hypothetical protein
VAIVYYDFQAATNGAGTSPAVPKNTFATPGNGDVLRFKRGSTWTRATQAGFGTATGLTLEAYANADGSDDKTLPKPILTSTQTASTNSYNFQGNGVHTIRNINFLNCTSGTNGGVVGMGAVAADSNKMASCIIEDCDFQGIGWNAIRSSGTDATASRSITIRRCTFQDIGEDAFYGCADVFEFAHNDVRNVSATSETGDGVGFLGCNPTLAWVHHNLIDHSSRPFKHCVIVDVTTAGSGLAIIEDNTLIGSIGNGSDNTTVVNMESAGFVRRNRIFSGRVAVNLSGAGGVMAGNVVTVLEAVSDSPAVALNALNCQVLNNTFLGNGTSVAPLLASASSQTGQVIRNNVAMNNGTFYQKGGGASETLSNNAFEGVTTLYTSGSSTDDVTTGAMLAADGRPMLGSPLLTGGFDRSYVRDVERKQGRKFIGAYAAARLRSPI